ncbi:MAG: TauD/TfdA family dioxygenase [Comamonas sp.]
MQVELLTCTIGAQVSGVSLGEASRDIGLAHELKALLLQHKVLFFRDQHISRAEHVAFARHFGELEDHPVVGSDPDHPGLVRIYRSDQREHYENGFHTDGQWEETPPMACVLRCIECPPVGGDTIWANMAQAYRKLPDDIKHRIDPLKVKCSIEHTFGAVMPQEKRLALGRQHPEVEHPVVRTHPETGEKILYVCGFATHFANYHTPQNVRCGQDYMPGAGLLLAYLASQAGIPEYQVRFRWQPDSVAMWDNRCTQHYAVQDYWPAPRKMERTAIVGDRPF